MLETAGRAICQGKHGVGAHSVSNPVFHYDILGGVAIRHMFRIRPSAGNFYQKGSI